MLLNAFKALLSIES